MEARLDALKRALAALADHDAERKELARAVADEVKSLIDSGHYTGQSLSLSMGQSQYWAKRLLRDWGDSVIPTATPVIPNKEEDDF